MEIWIGRDGERHGPYKEEDVRQWLRSGQVSRDDLGWYEGLADWQPLSTLFRDEAVDAPINPPTMAATPLPQATTAALEDYAGFWKRFAAWLLDYFVLFIPSGIILSHTGLTDAVRKLFAAAMGGQDTAVAMKDYVEAVHAAQPAVLATLVIGFLYYALLESSPWQATLGKLALGLRVTDLNGYRLSIGRSMARNVVRILNAITVLIPFICYIVVAWTSRKQGLHDMMAKALVLNGRAGDFKPASTPAAGGGNTFSA